MSTFSPVRAIDFLGRLVRPTRNAGRVASFFVVTRSCVRESEQREPMCLSAYRPRAVYYDSTTPPALARHIYNIAETRACARESQTLSDEGIRCGQRSGHLGHLGNGHCECLKYRMNTDPSHINLIIPSRPPQPNSDTFSSPPYPDHTFPRIHTLVSKRSGRVSFSFHSDARRSSKVSLSGQSGERRRRHRPKKVRCEG